MDGLFFWVIVALLIMVLGSLASLRNKVEAIRLRLNVLTAHLNVTPPTTVPPEVFGLLLAGRKIEAIKVYRAATGVGLAEAKKAVEELEVNGPGTAGKIIQA